MWIYVVDVCCGCVNFRICVLYVCDEKNYIQLDTAHNITIMFSLDSFVAAVKEIAKRDGKDVFFLDNGDNVDGTGLSNASPVDAQNLFPLLMKVPFDAMSLGNHELYFSSTIEMMVSSGYITSRNGSYLTSNVVFKANDSPLGSRYCILHGFNSGIRLLAFGFLYEMTDHSDIVRVEDVAKVVRSEWFVTTVAEENYDAIVVLAHMDNADSLVETLLSGIRALVSPHMPVVFLTGKCFHSRTKLAWVHLCF
jgi:2',3'-cyclic-nucleotide 2'-phosphodiesterase (5'-nucleotidase family)